MARDSLHAIDATNRGDGVPVGIHGRTLAQTASPSKTNEPPWTIVFSMLRVIVEPLGMSGVYMPAFACL